jgi:hypothetical protein
MFLLSIYHICETLLVLFSCIYSYMPSSVPLVITVEAVAAQEALERHGNPPKLLTNSFDRAMDIARQAQVLGRFGTPLTSIANRAFGTCRLLLLCVPPDGALLPSHPTERDYRNASILTSGLPALST